MQRSRHSPRIPLFNPGNRRADRRRALCNDTGIKLCESYNRQYGRDYRSVMPANLYGSFDNHHPENAYVIPALLRRFHEAVASGVDEIVIWGSGKPMREFLHVDDMAAASIYVMDMSVEAYTAETDVILSHINVGTSKDCSIRDAGRNHCRGDRI